MRCHQHDAGDADRWLNGKARRAAAARSAATNLTGHAAVDREQSPRRDGRHPGSGAVQVCDDHPGHRRSPFPAGVVTVPVFGAKQALLLHPVPVLHPVPGTPDGGTAAVTDPRWDARAGAVMPSGLCRAASVSSPARRAAARCTQKGSAPCRAAGLARRDRRTRPGGLPVIPTPR
jgi:hypothetical protein